MLTLRITIIILVCSTAKVQYDILKLNLQTKTSLGLESLLEDISVFIYHMVTKFLWGSNFHGFHGSFFLCTKLLNFSYMTK